MIDPTENLPSVSNILANGAAHSTTNEVFTTTGTVSAVSRNANASVSSPLPCFNGSQANISIIDQLPALVSAANVISATVTGSEITATKGDATTAQLTTKTQWGCVPQIVHTKCLGNITIRKIMNAQDVDGDDLTGDRASCWRRTTETQKQAVSTITAAPVGNGSLNDGIMNDDSERGISDEDEPIQKLQNSTMDAKYPQMKGAHLISPSSWKDGDKFVKESAHDQLSELRGKIGRAKQLLTLKEKASDLKTDDIHQKHKDKAALHAYMQNKQEQRRQQQREQEEKERQQRQLKKERLNQLEFAASNAVRSKGGKDKVSIKCTVPSSHAVPSTHAVHTLDQAVPAHNTCDAAVNTDQRPHPAWVGGHGDAGTQTADDEGPGGGGGDECGGGGGGDEGRSGGGDEFGGGGGDSVVRTTDSHSHDDKRDISNTYHHSKRRRNCNNCSGSTSSRDRGASPICSNIRNGIGVVHSSNNNNNNNGVPFSEASDDASLATHSRLKPDEALQRPALQGSGGGGNNQRADTALLSPAVPSLLPVYFNSNPSIPQGTVSSVPCGTQPWSQSFELQPVYRGHQCGNQHHQHAYVPSNPFLQRQNESGPALMTSYVDMQPLTDEELARLRYLVTAGDDPVCADQPQQDQHLLKNVAQFRQQQEQEQPWQHKNSVPGGLFAAPPQSVARHSSADSITQEVLLTPLKGGHRNCSINNKTLNDSRVPIGHPHGLAYRNRFQPPMTAEDLQNYTVEELMARMTAMLLPLNKTDGCSNEQSAIVDHGIHSVSGGSQGSNDEGHLAVSSVSRAAPQAVPRRYITDFGTVSQEVGSNRTNGSRYPDVSDGGPTYTNLRQGQVDSTGGLMALTNNFSHDGDVRKSNNHKTGLSSLNNVRVSKRNPSFVNFHRALSTVDYELINRSAQVIQAYYRGYRVRRVTRHILKRKLFSLPVSTGQKLPHVHKTKSSASVPYQAARSNRVNAGQKSSVVQAPKDITATTVPSTRGGAGPADPATRRHELLQLGQIRSLPHVRYRVTDPRVPDRVKPYVELLETGDLEEFVNSRGRELRNMQKRAEAEQADQSTDVLSRIISNRRSNAYDGKFILSTGINGLESVNAESKTTSARFEKIDIGSRIGIYSNDQLGKKIHTSHKPLNDRPSNSVSANVEITSKLNAGFVPLNPKVRSGTIAAAGVITRPNTISGGLASNGPVLLVPAGALINDTLNSMTSITLPVLSVKHRTSKPNQTNNGRVRENSVKMISKEEEEEEIVDSRYVDVLGKSKGSEDMDTAGDSQPLSVLESDFSELPRQRQDIVSDGSSSISEDMSQSHTVTDYISHTFRGRTDSDKDLGFSQIPGRQVPHASTLKGSHFNKPLIDPHTGVGFSPLELKRRFDAELLHQDAVAAALQQLQELEHLKDLARAEALVSKGVEMEHERLHEGVCVRDERVTGGRPPHARPAEQVNLKKTRVELLADKERSEERRRQQLEELKLMQEQHKVDMEREALEQERNYMQECRRQQQEQQIVQLEQEKRKVELRKQIQIEEQISRELEKQSLGIVPQSTDAYTIQQLEQRAQETLERLNREVHAKADALFSTAAARSSSLRDNWTSNVVPASRRNCIEVQADVHFTGNHGALIAVAQEQSVIRERGYLPDHDGLPVAANSLNNSAGIIAAAAVAAVDAVVASMDKLRPVSSRALKADASDGSAEPHRTDGGASDFMKESFTCALKDPSSVSGSESGRTCSESEHISSGTEQGKSEYSKIVFKKIGNASKSKLNLSGNRDGASLSSISASGRNASGSESGRSGSSELASSSVGWSHSGEAGISAASLPSVTENEEKSGSARKADEKEKESTNYSSSFASFDSSLSSKSGIRSVVINPCGVSTDAKVKSAEDSIAEELSVVTVSHNTVVSGIEIDGSVASTTIQSHVSTTSSIPEEVQTTSDAVEISTSIDINSNSDSSIAEELENFNLEIPKTDVKNCFKPGNKNCDAGLIKDSRQQNFHDGRRAGSTSILIEDAWRPAVGASSPVSGDALAAPGRGAAGVCCSYSVRSPITSLSAPSSTNDNSLALPGTHAEWTSTVTCDRQPEGPSHRNSPQDANVARSYSSDVTGMQCDGGATLYGSGGVTSSTEQSSGHLPATFDSITTSPDVEITPSSLTTTTTSDSRHFIALISKHTVPAASAGNETVSAVTCTALTAAPEAPARVGLGNASLSLMSSGNASLGFTAAPLSLPTSDGFGVTPAGGGGLSPSVQDHITTSLGGGGTLATTLALLSSLQEEEELKFQHHRSLLKLQEQALIEETKHKLSLLQTDSPSSTRKKQRRVLLQLRDQRLNIKKIISALEVAWQQNRLIVAQHQQLLASAGAASAGDALQHKRSPGGTGRVGIHSPLSVSPLMSKFLSYDGFSTSSEDQGIGSATYSGAQAGVGALARAASGARVAVKGTHERHAFSEEETSPSRQRRTSSSKGRALLLSPSKNKFLLERKKYSTKKERETQKPVQVGNDSSGQPASTDTSTQCWSKDNSETSIGEDDYFVSSSVSKLRPTTAPDQNWISKGLAASPGLFAAENARKAKVKRATGDAISSDKQMLSAHSQTDFIASPVPKLPENVLVVPSENADKAEILANTPSASAQYDSDLSTEQNTRDTKMLQGHSTVDASAFEDTGVLSDASSQVTVRNSSKLGAGSRSFLLPLRVSLSPRSPHVSAINKPTNISDKTTCQENVNGAGQGLQQYSKYSSESDDSFTLSQNETSEASDGEGKLIALQEQLAARKMEAEKLCKERRRLRRERLASQELALKKQILIYDNYIRNARQDLEKEIQESQKASAVRPVIKKPESRRNRTSDFNLLASPEKSDASDFSLVSEVSKSDHSWTSVVSQESVKSSGVGTPASDIKAIRDASFLQQQRPPLESALNPASAQCESPLISGPNLTESGSVSSESTSSVSNESQTSSVKSIKLVPLTLPTTKEDPQQKPKDELNAIEISLENKLNTREKENVSADTREDVQQNSTSVEEAVEVGEDDTSLSGSFPNLHSASEDTKPSDEDLLPSVDAAAAADGGTPQKLEETTMKQLDGNLAKGLKLFNDENGSSALSYGQNRKEGLVLGKEVTEDNVEDEEGRLSSVEEALEVPEEISEYDATVSLGSSVGLSALDKDQMEVNSKKLMKDTEGEKVCNDETVGTNEVNDATSQGTVSVASPEDVAESSERSADSSLKEGEAATDGTTSGSLEKSGNELSSTAEDNSVSRGRTETGGPTVSSDGISRSQTHFKNQEEEEYSFEDASTSISSGLKTGSQKSASPSHRSLVSSEGGSTVHSYGEDHSPGGLPSGGDKEYSCVVDDPVKTLEDECKTLESTVGVRDKDRERASSSKDVSLPATEEKSVAAHPVPFAAKTAKKTEDDDSSIEESIAESVEFGAESSEEDVLKLSGGLLLLNLVSTDTDVAVLLRSNGSDSTGEITLSTDRNRRRNKSLQTKPRMTGDEEDSQGFVAGNSVTTGYKQSAKDASAVEGDDNDCEVLPQELLRRSSPKDADANVTRDVWTALEDDLDGSHFVGDAAAAVAQEGESDTSLEQRDNEVEVLEVSLTRRSFDAGPGALAGKGTLANEGEDEKSRELSAYISSSSGENYSEMDTNKKWANIELISSQLLSGLLDETSKEVKGVLDKKHEQKLSQSDTIDSQENDTLKSIDDENTVPEVDDVPFDAASSSAEQAEHEKRTPLHLKEDKIECVCRPKENEGVTGDDESLEDELRQLLKPEPKKTSRGLLRVDKSVVATDPGTTTAVGGVPAIVGGVSVAVGGASATVGGATSTSGLVSASSAAALKTDRASDAVDPVELSSRLLQLLKTSCLEATDEDALARSALPSPVATDTFPKQDFALIRGEGSAISQPSDVDSVVIEFELDKLEASSEAAGDSRGAVGSGRARWGKPSRCFPEYDLQLESPLDSSGLQEPDHLGEVNLEAHFNVASSEGSWKDADFWTKSYESSGRGSGILSGTEKGGETEERGRGAVHDGGFDDILESEASGVVEASAAPRTMGQLQSVSTPAEAAPGVTARPAQHLLLEEDRDEEEQQLRQLQYLRLAMRKVPDYPPPPYTPPLHRQFSGAATSTTTTSSSTTTTTTTSTAATTNSSSSDGVDDCKSAQPLQQQRDVSEDDQTNNSSDRAVLCINETSRCSVSSGLPGPHDGGDGGVGILTPLPPPEAAVISSAQLRRLSKTLDDVVGGDDGGVSDGGTPAVTPRRLSKSDMHRQQQDAATDLAAAVVVPPDHAGGRVVALEALKVFSSAWFELGKAPEAVQRAVTFASSYPEHDTAGDCTAAAAATSRVAYHHLLWDTVQQLVRQQLQLGQQRQQRPWRLRQRPTLAVPRPPLTPSALHKAVVDALDALLGQRPPLQRESSLLLWANRRRDLVDQVLVRELGAEESSWTMYDDDEEDVKRRLADTILQGLLAETAALFAGILRQKMAAAC